MNFVSVIIIVCVCVCVCISNSARRHGTRMFSIQYQYPDGSAGAILKCKRQSRRRLSQTRGGGGAVCELASITCCEPSPAELSEDWMIKLLAGWLAGWNVSFESMMNNSWYSIRCCVILYYRHQDTGHSELFVSFINAQSTVAVCSPNKWSLFPIQAANTFNKSVAAAKTTTTISCLICELLSARLCVRLSLSLSFSRALFYWGDWLYCYVAAVGGGFPKKDLLPGYYARNNPNNRDRCWPLCC